MYGAIKQHLANELKTIEENGLFKKERIITSTEALKLKEVPKHLVIIGGGVSGTNAAKVAIGMGAEVIILDKSLTRIRYLCDIFGNSANVLYASIENIEKNVIDADLVIGAVLIPGASAPKVVSKKIVKEMKKLLVNK